MPSRFSERPEVIEDQGLPVRRLRTADQLRALAHPRRMEIIDLLIAEGPLTASQCATRLSDSAASCSYHLRQLARFGFVEEAEGGRGTEPTLALGPGRKPVRGERVAGRAGRRPKLSMPCWTLATSTGSGAFVPAAPRIRGVSSATVSDWAIWMTEQELVEVGEALTALLAPLQRRSFDGGQPPGSRLVDVLAYLMPRPVDGGVAPESEPGTERRSRRS